MKYSCGVVEVAEVELKDACRFVKCYGTYGNHHDQTDLEWKPLTASGREEMFTYVALCPNCKKLYVAKDLEK